MKWQSEYYEDFARILRANAHNLLTIRPGTPDEDMKRATDFVIELGGGGRVAARVRRDGKFYWDITLRSHSRGYKTELAKLQEGGTDIAKYYLYCWTEAKKISNWLLWDIDKMRDAGLLHKAWNEKDNGDGTKFIMIPILALQSANCVLAEHLPEPQIAIVNGQRVPLMQYPLQGIDRNNGKPYTRN